MVSIDDKYALERGRVFISGVHALVRLPMMQRQRDVAAGHNTAGYVSGYRGSPLGGYDHALWEQKERLEAHHVVFVPGINEELAATAVGGTQQLHGYPDPKYDGVFGLWYGKGPGVDRSGDALKHANLAGTAPLGGVLMVFGDDHAGKSSTVAHQSEQVVAASGIPVLYPATVQEIIDFGLLGWALSRFSGLWVGFKCVNETAENTASVNIDPARSLPVLPSDAAFPPGGVNFKPEAVRQLAPVYEEQRLVRWQLPLVHAFARANPIDRVVIDAPNRRFGLVAAGKSFLDTVAALQLLGLDAARARSLGIVLYKPGLIWPLEPQGITRFASGLEEVLFIEEKRAFIEDQAARILYGLDAAVRPRLAGKVDPQGTALLAGDYMLQPTEIARAIAARLAASGIADAALEDRAHALARRDAIDIAVADVPRTPYFCSGCPHNTSTNLPEGSLAGGGIGCHGMGVMIGRTLRMAQMGGEGLAWTGVAPFTRTPHVFQNLGDGTYSHSGLLAVHAAVAAGVNITYKILFNDAVAMTGGQPVEGGGMLTVQAITRQVAALGAKAIRVVTDEPDKYPREGGFAPGVTVHHRDTLDAVQRELREIAGTTVLVYDQTCATEKRRRRKRGLFPDPAVRAFINEAVCEGCGDCSVASNCVSVEPLETELGRKRRIDQSSCNKDFSCVKGFCPSFVTVHGGSLRKPRAKGIDRAVLERVPDPVVPALGPDAYNVLITGVGGTGVVTIGAVLGMAAHLEGKGVSTFDMTGLAQKGGSVLSHLKISGARDVQGASAVGTAEADLLLGCDLIVSGSKEALRSVMAGRTRIVLNTHLVPTAGFQRNPNIDFRADRTAALVRKAAGDGATLALDATAAALAVTGNALAANMLLVGSAYQLGALPLARASIERAIELNGVSVEQTKLAFAVGRLAAHDPGAIEALADKHAAEPASLEEFIRRRVDDLTSYQDAAYARRYGALVARVEEVESRLGSARRLTDAVARSFFKLLAYKDEYEVARLYADGTFERRLREQFEGDFRLRYHLAPPILAGRDQRTGHLRKMTFGPWMGTLFKLLARLRGLRGTAFDPFGRTAERRLERQAIVDYEIRVGELLEGLDAQRHDLAVEIASLPLQVKGFGHVKEANAEKVGETQARLMRQFREPRARGSAVEADRGADVEPIR